MNPGYPEQAQKLGLPVKVRNVKPFLAMEIMEKAQQLESRGISIIHLERGEPG